MDVSKNFGNIEKYKFKGRGQRETPVATFEQLLQILSQIPGKESKILRREQANISTRDGDEDFEETVRNNIEQEQNPVNNLGLMNLTDFKDCRITPDNKIAVYDAIVKFKGCTINNALKIFSRIDEITNYDFVKFQFKRSDGRKGRAVPVATFQELLDILSQIPGKEAKILRREQANISTSAIVRDEEVVNIEQEQNPVNNLGLMNLTMNDFKDCRITPDNKIAVYDAIATFKGCLYKVAHKIFMRINESSKIEIHEFQFKRSDGRKGRAVPVATFQELLDILSQIPGKEAKILRRDQANISTRAIAGDEDLEEAVNIEQEQNPVNNLGLMNLTMNDFKDCRITPDNKIAVYDAIVKFKGCTDVVSRNIFSRIHEVSKILLHEFQFKRSDGRKGRAVPVATFQELLDILSQIPGKEAKILRRDQANISTRAIAGDEDLEEAVRNRRQVVSDEEKNIYMNGLK